MSSAPRLLLLVGLLGLTAFGCARDRSRLTTSSEYLAPLPADDSDRQPVKPADERLVWSDADYGDESADYGDQSDDDSAAEPDELIMLAGHQTDGVPPAPGPPVPAPQQSDGQEPDGETRDGQEPDGQEPDGQKRDGQRPEPRDDRVQSVDVTGPRRELGDDEAVRVMDVAASVHRSFPLLEAAYLEATVASGKQLAAWGEFDTKLKAGSENGPTGFYQTYRHGAGFEQPLYGGGSVYGGYRVGRGFFQPWYLERQTNDGGEFAGAVRVPLLRNRDIDARRAELWRATYERQRVQPEIRMQLILFVRDASVAYWSWIAAGRKYDIAQRALELSLERAERLQRMVEEGELDPPVFQDNKRSIALRESKLIDRRRKLQQTAVKLSLFYRADDGSPLVLNAEQLSDFPDVADVNEEQLSADIQTALSRRPELAALDALYRQTRVDLAEARNDFLPSIDAQIKASQDMGQPTSSKQDKSEFEVEAGIFLDVPLQRRKARGKSAAAQAKLQQIRAKRRFVSDKITADVRITYAALVAAHDRLGRARQARELAEYMTGVENRTFEVGGSDLLAIFLRERAAIEAADNEVDALLEYFAALADYAAAMAFDWPRESQAN